MCRIYAIIANMATRHHISTHHTVYSHYTALASLVAVMVRSHQRRPYHYMSMRHTMFTFTPNTTTLARLRLHQGANMHPATPPPQGPNNKRWFPLPHTQATRDRKHQKPMEIGGQGAQGRSFEEFRDQVMYKLFGDLSDSDAEVEARANVGGEVIGANANNHIGGDEDHQNHNRRKRLPSRATTNHTYKSDNRGLSGNRWQDEKAESHSSVGLAKGSVCEAHHVVLGYQDMRGNREVMNSENEVHHQRIETNTTRIVASEFGGSKYSCNVDEDRKDKELKPTRKIGPIEEEDHEVLRDVFGDSDENGLALYGDTKDVNRSPTKGEGHCTNILQPKDIIRGKDMCYERESKRCPIGPPLNLVVPHIPPPGQPDRIKVMKVSNVVGINPKPFDPETYMEEDDFITDESEGKKMVHMNVVRWRMVKNADGTESRESNARFVQWKDGSMQLLIGDEALDVSVDESSHHTHLFMKNGKGLLQSQGRLLQKMRFMPPSPSSRSHRSLTTLVDSQNKKTMKVQTWYDTKDPERVKQDRERVEEKKIQARSILRKKKDKVNHKYTQPHKEKQKLTPGFLEEALNEDEEPDSRYNPHGRVAHTACEHDLEFEALAQRRIINAKVHEYSDSESEELEYETEFEDIESSPTHGGENELDENNGYDKDLEEPLGVASLPNEEMEVWQCMPDRAFSWNVLSLFTKSGMLFLEVSLIAFLLQGNEASGYESLARTFVISGAVVSADVLLKTIYVFGFGVPLFIDADQGTGGKWGLWILHKLMLTGVYGLIVFMHHSRWKDRLPAKPAYYQYVCAMLALNGLSLFGCFLVACGAGFGLWLYNLTTVCYHALYLPLLYVTFLADFFQEEDMLLENVYYSEMKDAGFFDADWD